MSVAKSVYLEITEEKNSLDYLEKGYKYIRKVQNDVNEWKWVVLSLHGALYGFAICALKGTNYERVVKKSNRKGSKLIGFAEAMKRCQNKKYMAMTTFSRILSLTRDQKRSFSLLNDLLRNGFQHYSPMMWAIEVHGLPQIALDALDAIRFLSLESGNYVDLTMTQKRKVKSLVYQSKLALKQS